MPKKFSLDSNGQLLHPPLRDVLRIANRNYDYFVGIARGIIADSKVSPKELIVFKRLILGEIHCPESIRFDPALRAVAEIANRIPDTLSEISDDVCEEFRSIFENLTGSPDVPNISPSIFCLSTPNIDFQGKIFCITGKSVRFKTRKNLSDEIVLRGGIVETEVTNRVDYLILCGEKSSQWAYSTHGTKVDKALRLGIKIVSEVELF